MSKIFPQIECDCCLEKKIKIIQCPANNKCSYSMCESCIKKLKTTTKSNLCPHCREPFFDESELITIQIVEDVFHEEPPVRITFSICNSVFSIVLNGEDSMFNKFIKKTYLFAECLEKYCLITWPLILVFIFFIKIYEGFFYTRKIFNLNYNDDAPPIKKHLCNFVAFILYIGLIFGSMCLCVTVSIFFKTGKVENIFCEFSCFIYNSLVGTCLIFLGFVISVGAIFLLFNLFGCLLNCERGTSYDDEFL